MSYRRNVASNFIFQIVKIGLGFVTSVIIARALGAEKQGEYAFIILIFGLLGSYGHGGILNATTYFQKRSNYLLNEVFSSNFIYSFFNVVVLSIVITALKLNNLLLNEYNYIILLIGISYIFFNYVETLTRSFYIGDERIHELNVYLFYGNLVYFLLLLVLFISGRLNVVLAFFSQLLMFMISSFFLLYKLKIKLVPKINFELLKLEFKYGIVVYFSALFIFLNYRADQFMIKFYLDPTELGIYSIGVKLAELLFLIPNSISTALIGNLYNIDVGNKNAQKIVITIASKYTFYASVFLSILGILMTPLVPVVYGEEFSRARLVIVLLFIGIIFASIGKTSYSYFFARGEPKVHLYITGLTLSINIFLNLFFIPMWGINGAALASTFSYLAYGIMYLLTFKIKENIPFHDFFYISKGEIMDIITFFKNKLKRTH